MAFDSSGSGSHFLAWFADNEGASQLDAIPGQRTMKSVHVFTEFSSRSRPEARQKPLPMLDWSHENGVDSLKTGAGIPHGESVAGWDR